MDLTPIYIFIAVICAVFTFGLVIIDHRPIRIILLAGILGSVAVGVNLHHSTKQARIDAANLELRALNACHTGNLDENLPKRWCTWSSK